MALPEPILDDVRFQSLVDEARRRIVRYCPEWTEYNLSDPGITLIELFAWMTELITYRLNLVPEKNYIRFLDLVGIRLQPASCARTELTFRLSVPFPINPGDETTAVVPQGTEVATRFTEGDPTGEVIFTTDRRLAIIPPICTQLRREADFNKNYLPRLAVEPFPCFNQPPQVGDTFYLGLDESRGIGGHILRLDFECDETQAPGVRRADPPWVWECSMGDGGWQEVPPSTFSGERDTTGGLNNARGSVVLYLPIGIKPDAVQGRNAYWLRCRVEQRRKEQGMYTQSPRVHSLKAYSLGATTTAAHAVLTVDELLGISNGEPGQVFHLQNAPVLPPSQGETVEVEEMRDGELVYVPWHIVEDCSHSDRHDRHLCLDTASGEVSFGPSIRQPDGTVRQYGRVPEAGRRIRFSQYRRGGGAAGNVPAGKLHVIKTAIPYVDSVSNLYRAEGGRDPETLEEAKLRARREIRAQHRAVTAEDYENIAKSASRAIGRVKCNAPGNSQKPSTLPPGTIELLVVPAASDALKAQDLSKLAVDPELIKLVVTHLEPYRLLTTTLRIREPQYLGVKICAEVVATPYVPPEIVQARVAASLQHYISPLALDDGGRTRGAEARGGEDGWEGWPFGRSLFISEIYSLIQKVAGVKHVLDVKFYTRPVVPSQERPPAIESRTDLPEGAVEAKPTAVEAKPTGAEPGAAVEAKPTGVEAGPTGAEPALTLVEGRRIDIPADTLLCSLEHQIVMVEL